uniref:Uncharacterized protein n=1 Tax=Timema tahoe TaxID=61484 RepID=A0A7R9IQU3_9NEOP|nr:unnamed protein product [Timema tahoe]
MDWVIAKTTRCGLSQVSDTTTTTTTGSSSSCMDWLPQRPSEVDCHRLVTLLLLLALRHRAWTGLSQRPPDVDCHRLVILLLLLLLALRHRAWTGYRKDHQKWTVTELTGNSGHPCPYEGEKHSLPHIPIPDMAEAHPPPPYQPPNPPAEPENSTPVVPASSSTDSLTPLNGTRGTLPEGLEFVVVVKDGKLQLKEKLPDHITRPLRAKRSAIALRTKRRISKPVNQNIIDFELMCGEEPNINGRYNYNFEIQRATFSVSVGRIWPVGHQLDHTDALLSSAVGQLIHQRDSMPLAL